MDSQYITPQALKNLRERYFDPRMGAERQLSQQELADMLGYKIVTIKKWESGELIPGPSALYVLSKIYGVGLEFNHKKLHPLIAVKFDSMEDGSPLSKIPDSPRELPEI